MFELVCQLGIEDWTHTELRPFLCENWLNSILIVYPSDDLSAFLFSAIFKQIPWCLEVEDCEKEKSLGQNCNESETKQNEPVFILHQ